MNYKVKLFALLKSKAGKPVWSYNSEKELKASELLTAFFTEFKDLEDLKKVTRLAINQAFSNEDLLLKETDELAFIPPVSGG